MRKRIDQQDRREDAVEPDRSMAKWLPQLHKPGLGHAGSRAPVPAAAASTNKKAVGPVLGIWWTRREFYLIYKILNLYNLFLYLFEYAPKNAPN